MKLFLKCIFLFLQASDFKSITSFVTYSSGKFQSVSSTKKCREIKLREMSGDKNQKNMTESLAVHKISSNV
jgi:hypothetical protein